MEQLARLRNRIVTIQELGQIIRAMRSLAAMRVQQAQAALPGIRKYAAIAGNSIVSVLPFASVPDTARRGDARSPRILIVFCAEHGFVGDFNDVLLKRAAREMAARPTQLFLLGSRGADMADERGLALHWHHAMATHAGGVLGVTRRLTPALYRALGEDGVRDVDLLFGRYAAGAQWSVELLRLLPPDLLAFEAPRRQTPLHNLPADTLVAKLVEEYVLAELTSVAMESLASENGARLRAMEEANDNVVTLIDRLQGTEHQLRQDEITTELLDVVTGTMSQAGAEV